MIQKHIPMYISVATYMMFEMWEVFLAESVWETNEILKLTISNLQPMHAFLILLKKIIIFHP